LLTATIDGHEWKIAIMDIHEYVVHIKGEAVEDTRLEVGNWIVASLNQTVGWDKDDQIIVYEGKELLVLGQGQDCQFLPSVAVNFQKLTITKEGAQKLIARFLSALNWSEGIGSISIQHWHGGSHPIRSRSQEGMTYTTNDFRITYLPQNLPEDLRKALALYREGVGLSRLHPGYSFLSFYKIINLVHRGGRAQKNWIRQSIGSLSNEAQRKAQSLTAEYNQAIDTFLYDSCRCAVAHAGEITNVDPDNVEDSIRLQKGSPLIHALAEYMISSHFGLPTKQQIWRDHYYEVAGFERLFSEAKVDQILSSEFVASNLIDFPEPLSIRQWYGKKYGVMDRLSARVRRIREGVIFVKCHSPDELFHLDLIVDLGDSRVSVEIERAVIQPGINNEHLRYEIDKIRFIDDLLLNGEVEIFLADSGTFLGRKDANLPLNIDQARTHEILQVQIQALQDQLTLDYG
jgi:hypothetical protein